MSTRSVIPVGEEVTIQLLLGRNKECRGIGAVSVAGVALRDGRFPLLPRSDTPEGYQFDRLFLESVERGKGGAVHVSFRWIATPGLRQEYLDEYEQALVNVALPREPVEDRLVLELRPVSLALGGRQWTGFSYSLQFASGKRKVHRLVMDGSWELGGSIVGNTVLSQGQCNMPVYQGARNTVFATACLKTLEQYGLPNGYSYQLAPRGGLVQAFDFQYGQKGALFQYWPRFSAISSVIESPRGSTLLRVLDEYRVELSGRAATTPQHVLFTPGPIADHEARDLWWAARERVLATIRKPFRVAPTAVVPELRPSYTTRVVDGGVKMTVVPGVEADSREVPYAIGDHLFPRLAKAGIRRFFPEVMSESDMTVDGLRRKADAGIHGDLCCGSICATHRLLPSEFWGGMKAWRYMAEKARSHGIELGAWFSTALSPRAAVLRKHPEWRMRAVNSLTWSGGYGVGSIVTMDLNHRGYFDWLLADIRRWKEEGGLDYLMTDSWSNLNLLGYNCAERMRSNLPALGRLYGEFQKLGIKAFAFEGISPFGISGFGVIDLQGSRMAAVQGVVGQNDLGWWIGHEDMAVDINIGADRTQGRSPEALADMLFRLMATRGGAMIHRFNLEHELPDWHVRLNRIYMQALPHMTDARRTVLPGGAGIRWEEGGSALFWVCKDIRLAAGGARVERLTETAAREHIDAAPRVTLKAGNVYRVSPWRAQGWQGGRDASSASVRELRRDKPRRPRTAR